MLRLLKCLIAMTGTATVTCLCVLYELCARVRVCVRSYFVSTLECGILQWMVTSLRESAENSFSSRAASVETSSLRYEALTTRIPGKKLSITESKKENLWMSSISERNLLLNRNGVTSYIFTSVYNKLYRSRLLSSTRLFISINVYKIILIYAFIWNVLKVLSKSESVKFSLIESVICLFTDSSVKKYDWFKFRE